MFPKHDRKVASLTQRNGERWGWGTTEDPMSQASEERHWKATYRLGAWDGWRGRPPLVSNVYPWAYMSGYNFGHAAAGELCMSSAEFRRTAGKPPT